MVYGAHYRDERECVLVGEFRLTENALAQPEAFVAGLRDAIESAEEEP